MRYFSPISFSFFLFPFSPCFPQCSQNIQLLREEILFAEQEILTDSLLGNALHSSIKPYSQPAQISDTSTSLNKFSIGGIFSSALGYEQSPFNNTEPGSAQVLEGGLSLNLKIKNKLWLNTSFLSGNSSFQSYLDTFIINTNVVPQIGTAYSSKNGYSYQYYSGYFSFSPGKIFNFQIGKDKHFWGDGYRSLFLSDISNSFPFLKISTTIWKLKYVSLFAWMKDITNASGLKRNFLNKYGTFHYLSWNVTKRLNLGLFESVIWQGNDSNRIRSFDVNYLNPVIFFRPVEYSLGSSDNAFLGLSFKIKVARKQQFYGQIILDEFLLKEVRAGKGWWGNKQGAQFGFRSFDLFKIKNLILQTEFNAVRPYTYSHGSVQQNYANYGQPLAHPLGANFAESVSFLNYRYKRWLFETEFLYAMYGKNEVGINWGQDIFQSYSSHPQEYGNEFFQGLKTTLLFSKIKISYYIIPSADLLAEAGVAGRQESRVLGTVSLFNSNFFYLGMKMGMQMNRYEDF